MTTSHEPTIPPPRRLLPWNAVERRLAKVGISGRVLVLIAPVLWLLVFFLVPLAVVFGISLATKQFGRPPYSALLSTEEGTVQLTLHLSNYIRLFTDSLYVAAYLSSIRIAAIATVITLIIGYPMAYAIARASDRWRNILLMLVVLPFFTSFLLRVYALTGFMRGNGVINQFLEATNFQAVIDMWNRAAMFISGAIDGFWFVLTGSAAGATLAIPSLPWQMMQTDFAVYVGIVYTYLPFMILPLYTTLVKLDVSLFEASADLGARPLRTFLSVTLPLSMPGVVAGSMLVFIPAIGEFVIPSLLGGPGTLMIGRVLWDEFFTNTNWPRAAAVAMAMLVVVVVPIMLLQRAQNAVVEK